MADPRRTSDVLPRFRTAAPWLMLLGVAGIALALLGVSMPVLSCVLLVGLGADADLARRTPLFEAVGIGWAAAPVRAVHAAMYAGLYSVGWAAMAAVAPTGWGRTLLAVDLAVSLVLLLGVARLANSLDRAE